MTPNPYQERAMQIAKRWFLLSNPEKIKSVAEDIATALREAVEEAFARGREQGAFECRHAKSIGVAEAYEEAAKMAENYSHHLAADIRAKAIGENDMDPITGEEY